ncbi:MAG: mocA [Ilumatobacteraceae bacterium]|nr:mocA [Ilumatobacteraceae bacterium]
MPLDHYVTLGRSGLRVSPLCLGAMNFGDETGMGCSVEVSNHLMDRYIDLGGNFIDTSNNYSAGRSEQIIGDHIGRVPARRTSMVIATKFSGNLRPSDPNGGGANRKSIMSACDDSLRRLQTDYIDLYWHHWEDPFTPVDETMRALDDLVSSGKVRYVGFSDTRAWRVAEAHVTAMFRGWAPVAAIQVEYSLLQRTVEGDLIPMAQSMGFGVTPWGPLRSGALSGKYTRDDMKGETAPRAAHVAARLDERAFAVVDAARAIGDSRQTPMARVALAWLLAQPGVTSPIIGVRTMEQLDQNVAALDVVLTADEIATLNQVSAPTLGFPADFLDRVLMHSFGGLTVNGRSFPARPGAR